MNVENKVKQFISRFYRAEELELDVDIFEKGYVNSLFAMQLVMYLEKEFLITVDDSDMEIDNFRTVNKIISFVQNKLGV